MMGTSETISPEDTKDLQIKKLQEREIITQKLMQGYRQKLLDLSKQVTPNNSDELDQTKEEIQCLRSKLERVMLTNSELCTSLADERLKSSKIVNDYEINLKQITELGNSQLGQLKIQNEKIHSMETDVMNMANKPWKMVWNKLSRTGIPI